MKQYFLFWILLLTMVNNLVGQDTALVRTYGGLYSEVARRIIECEGGGYAMVGTSGSDQAAGTSVYVQRLDNEMHCLWNKVIGTIYPQGGSSIIEDESGNLLVVGYTGSAEGYDALVIKLSYTGDVIWQKTYGGMDWDFAYDISEHPSDGFLICGKTFSLGNGNGDGYLVHINDDGDIIQEYTYGGPGNDEFLNIIVLNEETIIVGGRNELQNGEIVGWCVALNDEFIIQWSKYFVDFPNGRITDLKVADNGNFLLSGSYGDNEGDYKYGYYQKLTPAGAIVWYQSSTEYTIESIAQNADHVYVVGETSLFGLGGSSAIILRLGFSGNWQSGAAFGEVYDEVPHHVIVDSQDAVIMVGSSNSYSPNLYDDAYAVKFENSELVSNYNLEINHEDCLTLSIDEVNDGSPTAFGAQGMISVFWESKVYNLTLYDMLGRKVIQRENYVDGSKVDISDLNAGCYVVFLQHGNIGSSIRIIIDRDN